MNGSEKQIEWAEKIKKEMTDGFCKYQSHPILDIAKKYILDIDNANFWIDEARGYEKDPIHLVKKFSRQGLRIKGNEWSNYARINEQSGEITESEDI